MGRKAWMVRPPTLCAKKETSQAKAPSIAEFSYLFRRFGINFPEFRHRVSILFQLSSSERCLGQPWLLEKLSPFCSLFALLSLSPLHRLARRPKEQSLRLKPKDSALPS